MNNSSLEKAISELTPEIAEGISKAAAEFVEKQESCLKNTGHANQIVESITSPPLQANYTCKDCGYFGSRPLNAQEYKRHDDLMNRPMTI